MTVTRTIKLLFPLLFVVYTLVSSVDAANPVVDLGYARYAGTLNPTSKITQFLGLRFAAPPVGK